MAADLVVARVVHILAAAIWVGGTIFLVAVAVPYARSFGPERRSAVAAEIGRRYRPLAWSALLALIASGLYTMWKFGLLSWAALTATQYGTALLVKLALVVLIVVFSALHDFVLGPRAEATGRRGPLLVLARTNGVLTLIVPVIGVLLAH